MNAADADLIIRAIEVLALIGGGGIFIFKMGRAVSRFETVAERQSDDISDMKNDMKNLTKVMMEQAVHEQRMTNLSERQTLVEKQVDDLRRGEGYILPLFPKPSPQGDKR